MSKNRIISQMFDVRPVDEAGDLDWKKIQSVGNVTECIGDEPLSGERICQTEIEEIENIVNEYDGSGVNAYILGNLIESKNVPVLHNPEFNFNDFVFEDVEQENVRKKIEERKNFERQQIALALKTEKEEKERQRLALIENEKRRLLKQQETIIEKNRQVREREDALVAQKIAEQNRRQNLMKAQAVARQEELKKITKYNRKQQEAYEIGIAIEKEKRQREYDKWLEEEIKAEAKAKKLEEAIAKRIEKNKNKSSRINWFAGKSDAGNFSWQELFFPKQLSFQFDTSKALMNFVVVALVISLSVGSAAYASKGFGLKERVLGMSSDGLENLNGAIDDISNQNFEGSTAQFDKAFANFSEGSKQLESMGGVLLDATRFVPFASKVSSGKNALEAGKHFSAAGKSLNEVAKVVLKLKDSNGKSEQLDSSLLDILKVSQKNLIDAKKELAAAQENIDRISIDDLPEDKRDKFLLVKKQLPDLLSAMDLFLNNSHILADLLGGNGPRKYLFLFQNNSEMRATGGFIGSYGLLDISNGHVKNFFIDGIFNPDGQLKDKIVPPFPIQKISANWSMHDSNWFADFPLSAKKAISFYEKTGGPTADGVITLTPTVMQKLLEITGPIEMPEYEATLDSKNFIELTQFKVEVDYDKEENKPKKILSDLAPMVLEKLLSSNDLGVVSKTAQAFLEGLSEKHILFYSENSELQKIISEQGWSGEVIQTPKDYISVINTNVNGYKTDAVVDESIKHTAQIQADGSIIDTVTITRKHNGGSSQYEWLNKVNADYMRVYVPKGSKLLEVEGQTREANEPPLDYDALGFKRDADVQSQENSISIDQQSGTRIYEESDKTVFANWTYVSPQETMTITYKYLLPFSLFKVSIDEKQQADSYSLVAQKQSGSVGSAFVSSISYPSEYDIKWSFPNENNLETETKLDKDRFFGAVFEKKEK